MIHATTIVCVRRGAEVAIAGDGQVSLGNTIMKQTANKIRRLGNGTILAGFAGSAADAFTLFEKFETKLAEFQNNMSRGAVELAKDWRNDRILRKLEALLLIADKNNTFILSGNGDVIEPDAGAVGIGSGGPYAQSAALALLGHTPLSPKKVAEAAIGIAADICVFTNHHIVIEEL